MAATSRIFGELPAVAAGTTFPSRRELGESGVHRPPRRARCSEHASTARDVMSLGWIGRELRNLQAFSTMVYAALLARQSVHIWARTSRIVCSNSRRGVVMGGGMRTELQQSVVEALISSKAVDLKAISNTMSEFAERAALNGDDLIHIINKPFMWACGWPGPDLNIDRKIATRGE